MSREAELIEVDRKRLEFAIDKITHQILLCDDGERIDSLDAQKRVLERKLRDLPIVVNGKTYPGGGNTPVANIPLPALKEGEAMRANEFLGEAFDEYLLATELHGGFNSAHEAYGVLLEEVEEFWDEVKKKRSKRDVKNMRKELVQIAAMALKAAMVLT